MKCFYPINNSVIINQCKGLVYVYHYDTEIITIIDHTVDVDIYMNCNLNIGHYTQKDIYLILLALEQTELTALEKYELLKIVNSYNKNMSSDSGTKKLVDRNFHFHF